MSFATIAIRAEVGNGQPVARLRLAAPVLLALNLGFLSIGAGRTMNIDQRKVNRAIRDCLSCAEQVADRLAKIEGFLLLLKMSGEWDEVELHQVETRVRKILCAILDDANATAPEAT
jgi:hypothetical protein